MAKYYVDTCIWRDYWEDRNDNLRPLGEFALQFFRMVETEEHIIIYSDLTIKELKIMYNDTIIREILSVIPEELLLKITFNEKQLSRARNISLISGIPLNDALHIIMSKDNHCILVSRDIHMIEFGDAVKPEEL
jgi:hypothetical protein